MRKKEKHRIQTDPALSTPPSDKSKSTDQADEFDFDRHIVERVDESLWRAVYNGEFRLAVKCDRCGRWLTAGASKRNRLGAHCASKTADQ